MLVGAISISQAWCDLKPPHVISPISSSFSSEKSQLVPAGQVEGRMYAMMRIRNLCVSSGFSIRMTCNSRAPVDHLSSLWEDTVLLRTLRSTFAIPRPWCLWMTVMYWSTSCRFGHVNVSCKHIAPKSQTIFSRTAPCLLALSQFNGHILKCLLDSLSVCLILRLWPPHSDLRVPPVFQCFRRAWLIDVSSQTHDPHCAGMHAWFSHTRAKFHAYTSYFGVRARSHATR